MTPPAELPLVFRGSDLPQLLGETTGTASRILATWINARLAVGLGGGSDVYCNLAAHPHADFDAAIFLAMPSATYNGIDALRNAGWTAQVTYQVSMAVDASKPWYQPEPSWAWGPFHPFKVDLRSPEWFDAVRIALTEASSGYPRMLRPAWALADLIATEGWVRCGLAPDDIDWDEVVPEDEDDWRAACTAFGLPQMDLMAYAIEPRTGKPYRPVTTGASEKSRHVLTDLINQRQPSADTPKDMA